MINNNAKWTEEEDAFLLPYLTLPPSKQTPLLAILPERTDKGISSRIAHLRKRHKIKVYNHRWNKDEQETIQRFYKGYGTDYTFLATLLTNRTEAAIKSYCIAMRHKFEAKMLARDDEPKMVPCNAKCLRCYTTFRSWDHKRNRICEPCSTSNSNGSYVTHLIHV